MSNRVNALPIENSENFQAIASPLKAPYRVLIKSWGCQMNVYDSERMQDILSELGYAATSEADQADLIILNTCHIREKASEKLYSELGRLIPLKRHNPRLRLAVAGCVAQAEGDEIFARQPEVDFVFGPQNYQELPRLLAEADAQTESMRPIHLLATDFPEYDKFDHLPQQRSTSTSAVTAFLSIQEGCDKFCSFCVVPYTRGAEYSRPADAILQEAQQLIAGGVQEITLLGQNVNGWHGLPPKASSLDTQKNWDFGRLLYALCDLDGLKRLRYTTSHPRDVTPSLINAHAELEALMPLIHLPVQSGSDQILKAMNRKHTADDYLRLIDQFRDAQPEIAFTSDFIVGYPEECDEDHQASLNLIRKVGYAASFSFKYSPRPGTPAAERPQLEEPIKQTRLAELQALLAEQQRQFNQSMVGQTCSILLEKKGRYDGQLVGRSAYLQPVHIDAPESWLGKQIECKIDRLQGHSLFATPLNIN